MFESVREKINDQFNIKDGYASTLSYQAQLNFRIQENQASMLQNPVDDGIDDILNMIQASNKYENIRLGPPDNDVIPSSYLAKKEVCPKNMMADGNFQFHYNFGYGAGFGDYSQNEKYLLESTKTSKYKAYKGCLYKDIYSKMDQANCACERVDLYRYSLKNNSRCVTSKSSKLSGVLINNESLGMDKNKTCIIRVGDAEREKLICLLNTRDPPQQYECKVYNDISDRKERINMIKGLARQAVIRRGKRRSSISKVY
ncbi:hypothetical protein AX774_g4323 [Zancudomyces culisetae]|uniref:Uncharacterized protein n=1 Tax=Zancudomyces culisetae TaxID=1213189 RepID=A0A1R1PMK7_ZANCU|nr:hypothetical protein AX774_g4323 [Zancudomyces culisetae]|eukprot:OMH82205.1 hypothetical protein AX774_g4323 [Zancudomyces culisetae]